MNKNKAQPVTQSNPTLWRLDLVNFATGQPLRHAMCAEISKEMNRSKKQIPLDGHVQKYQGYGINMMI